MSRRIDTMLGVAKVLDECMRTESIERIRVNALCREAGISRTTFYEYFDDIYGVATWMWDYLMSQTLYRCGIEWDCYEAHLRKFRILLRYRDFFANAYKVVGYASVTQHGGRSMETHVRELVERKRGVPLSEDESLELEFFVTGAKHMTRHWAERGMKEDPERMARLFTRFVPAFALPYLEPDPDFVPIHNVAVPLD